MDSADVIVVGAGPSGTFAAYQLRGRDVLVLDVGHRPTNRTLAGNLYDLRKAPAAHGVDLAAELLGRHFESLHNVFHPYLSPKLKAPRMRFVTEGAPTLSPVVAENFDSVMSFAAGGMANAWGAGLYRFTTEDLTGYPIVLADLEPYYDIITAKVGISGADDDLSRFFGSARGLQPPVELGTCGRALLRRYEGRRALLNQQGFYVGRPRLAVLTREHDGRPAYRYEALEFFRPNDPAVYTPTYTLDEMVRRGEIAYRSGLLVEAFAETGTAVTVRARDCDTGERRTFTCRRLILAAGTINSARIALESNGDHATELPLLDTALAYLPLVDPWGVGRALDKFVYSAAMLNAVYAGEGYPRPVQMTLYGVVGTLRSDFLFDFPLSVRGNVAAAKYLTPALVLVQLSYPDAAASSHLRLLADGRLEIRNTRAERPGIELLLLRLFRKMGYLGSPALCRRLTPGNSYRYAGTLPMSAAPAGRYQTFPNGLLSGTRAVYVADAATLSALPSKNHSFTMMANAMRIAEHVDRTLP
jgi:choline dehydrogenase-like flavoprotein